MRCYHRYRIKYLYTNWFKIKTPCKCHIVYSRKITIVAIHRALVEEFLHGLRGIAETNRNQAGIDECQLFLRPRSTYFLHHIHVRKLRVIWVAYDVRCSLLWYLEITTKDTCQLWLEIETSPNSLWSVSIRHWSAEKVSERCLIEVNPTGFVFWAVVWFKSDPGALLTFFRA